MLRLFGTTLGALSFVPVLEDDSLADALEVVLWCPTTVDFSLCS
jgi:hypothetical protein